MRLTTRPYPGLLLFFALSWALCYWVFDYAILLHYESPSSFSRRSEVGTVRCRALSSSSR